MLCNFNRYLLQNSIWDFVTLNKTQVVKENNSQEDVDTDNIDVLYDEWRTVFFFNYIYKIMQ